jgi:hypothetical protein
MDAGRVWVRVGDAIKLREDGARIHRQVPTNYFPFKVRHANRSDRNPNCSSFSR